MNNHSAVFEFYMRKGTYRVRLGKANRPHFCNCFS